jgi:hypothetical protein
MTKGRASPTPGLDCGTRKGRSRNGNRAVVGEGVSLIERRPSSGLRHLKAGIAFDVFDDGGQVLLGSPFVHRVFKHEPRGLAHPHRHAELFALRHRESAAVACSRSTR